MICTPGSPPSALQAAGAEGAGAVSDAMVGREEPLSEDRGAGRGFRWRGVLSQMGLRYLWRDVNALLLFAGGVNACWVNVRIP